MADRLLTIGSFALVSGLSIAALRHYDEVDVLKPAQVDRRTGCRYYHADQVRPARMIRSLRGLDLPLDAIREVLGARDAEHVRSLLSAHRQRLVGRSHELSRMLAIVDEFIEKGVIMTAVTGCRIVEINIGAKDLGESLRFYEDVFEVKFDEDKHGDGPVHYHVQFGTWPSDQFFLLNIRERPGTSSFGFLVEHLEAIHKRALDAGAKELSPPVDTPGMPRNSGFEDPSGNIVWLYQG